MLSKTGRVSVKKIKKQFGFLECTQYAACSGSSCQSFSDVFQSGLVTVLLDFHCFSLPRSIELSKTSWSFTSCPKPFISFNTSSMSTSADARRNIPQHVFTCLHTAATRYSTKFPMTTWEDVKGYGYGASWLFYVCQNTSNWKRHTICATQQAM